MVPGSSGLLLTIDWPKPEILTHFMRDERRHSACLRARLSPLGWQTGDAQAGVGISRATGVYQSQGEIAGTGR